MLSLISFQAVKAGRQLPLGGQFTKASGGGFTGVTTCGGSGVIVRLGVSVSRLVHAAANATSMASESKTCICPASF